MKRLFVLLFLMTIAACGRETEPAEETRPEAPPELVEETPPPATTASYRCGDISVMAAFSGDEVTLTIDGKNYTLRQAVSASGAKYEDPENPDNTFWTKGDEAQLTLGGDERFDCELRTGDSPADGASHSDAYHAIGQEPGWILTLDATGMTLEYDYGQKTLAVAAPERREVETHLEYSGEANGQTLAARVFDEYCADAMSGRPYPDRVEVAIDGRTLQGCGGDTRDLLTGGEWVVEDINGGGVVDMARTSLQFDDGVSGSGGCNSYSGAYEITGEGLSFGPIAATKRACAPAVMNQEQKFFDALEAARRFEITETGALHLTSGAGQSIMARQTTTPSP